MSHYVEAPIPETERDPLTPLTILDNERSLWVDINKNRTVELLRLLLNDKHKTRCASYECQYCSSPFIHFTFHVHWHEAIYVAWYEQNNKLTWTFSWNIYIYTNWPYPDMKIALMSDNRKYFSRRIRDSRKRLICTQIPWNKGQYKVTG